MINWRYTDWQKIILKLHKIQKKIYKASKEYDKKNVYKLQQAIMNSYDIKLLAVHKVTMNMSEYYLNYFSEKYNFNDNDKTIVYSSLCQNCIIDNKIINVLEKVKEYIIYLCIKPEWEAKIEPLFKSSIFKSTESNFIYRLSQFFIHKLKLYAKYLYYDFNHIIYKIEKVNKCIDYTYLKNKIDGLTYIKISIHRSLKYQNLLESINYSLYIQPWNNCNSNSLHKYLYNLIVTGFQWFSIISLILVYQFDFDFLPNEFYIFTDRNIYNEIICAKNSKQFKSLDNIRSFLKAVSLSIQSNNQIQKVKPKFTNYLISYHNNLMRLQICNNVYKILFGQIRNIFYHKDVFKKSRANSNFSLKTILARAHITINNFCIFYYPMFYSFNLNSFLQSFNKNIILKF